MGERTAVPVEKLPRPAINVDSRALHQLRSSEGGKKLHRFRPGAVALRGMRKFQTGPELLVRRAGFRRFVREISSGNYLPAGFRFQSSAIDAIQEATESYVIALLADASLGAIYARRAIVGDRDVHLARRMRVDRV